MSDNMVRSIILDSEFNTPVSSAHIAEYSITSWPRFLPISTK